MVVSPTLTLKIPHFKGLPSCIEEELVVTACREVAEALHRDDHRPVTRFVLLAELDEPSRAWRFRPASSRPASR